MSGCVQWWPARTATPSKPTICATSCGWTPCNVERDDPAATLGGAAEDRDAVELRPAARARTPPARARAPRSRRARPPRGSRSQRRARRPARSAASRPRTCAAARSRSSARSRRTGSSRRRARTAPSPRGARSRPQRTPIPVGAHILWPVKARKSTPSACTSSAPVRRGLAGVEDDDRALLVAPRPRAARPG